MADEQVLCRAYVTIMVNHGVGQRKGGDLVVTNRRLILQGHEIEQHQLSEIRSVRYSAGFKHKRNPRKDVPPSLTLKLMRPGGWGDLCDTDWYIQSDKIEELNAAFQKAMMLA